MIVIAYLIGALLALALIAWVYFDATELGKPAIPWAIAQPVLFWFLFLPLVLYAIFREQGQHRLVPPGGARRQAMYVVSFIGYAALAYGLSALLATLVVSITTHVGGEAASELISSSVAAIIVGGLMWVIAWLPAEDRVQGILDDAEFRATFYLHRSYIYTIVGLSVLILAVFGLWFMAGLIMSLGGKEDIDVEAWTWTVGPLSMAALSVAVHYWTYLNSPRFKEMAARFDSIPPLPMVGGGAPTPGPAAFAAANPVTSPHGFCTKCGAPQRQGDVFCANCGTRL